MKENQVTFFERFQNIKEDLKIFNQTRGSGFFFFEVGSIFTLFSGVGSSSESSKRSDQDPNFQKDRVKIRIFKGSDKDLNLSK